MLKKIQQYIQRIKNYEKLQSDLQLKSALLAATQQEVKDLETQLIDLQAIVKRQTPPTNETKHLYTDKFGNNWFGFKTFEYLPNDRREQFIIATTALELNLTKQDLNKYIDTINALADDIVKTPENKFKIFSLNERLRERANLAAYYKVIADLVNVFFLLEGEDPNTLSQEFTIKKTKLLEQDNEAKKFFFVLLTQHIYNSRDISETEIWEYLLNQINNPHLHRLSLNEQ